MAKMLIKMMLLSGQITTTITGRKCSPFPKINCTTNRKAINAVKKVDAWLKENAIIEAMAQENDFVKQQFELINLKNISQADRDSMYLFTFGEIN